MMLAKNINYVENNNNNNVVIATFTTANVWLILYDMLNISGESVVYYNICYIYTLLSLYIQTSVYFEIGLIN